MREFVASVDTPRDARRAGSSAHWLGRLFAAGLAVALALFVGVPQAAQAGDGSVVAAPTALATGSGPDFDAVVFRPLVCAIGGDPHGDENPSSIDLVGDAGHAPTYFAWDDSYLYFRFRVTANPTGTKGFDQYAWVVLMQVPSGNPFQDQFELALNGKGADDDFGNTGGQKGDTIEIWKNDPAEDISFTPLFNDPSEVRLFAQRHDYAGPATANTTPLARIALAADGSSFGGDDDYFVDVAFPVSVLIAKGVISSTAQISESLFFPATSADANQYNKDHLDCPFLPYTTLSITKGVTPSSAPAGSSTAVVHTITVRNVGDGTAKGLVIDDTAFPAVLSNVTVHVSSDEPTVTWTVVTSNPLLIKVPRLPQGRSITVAIDSNANFTCSTPAFTNTADAHATNADQVSAQATLAADEGSAEICDGKDNNCNGQIDEGSGLCDDGNACNGTESCVSGTCVAGLTLQCAGSNPCVDDSCDPAAGCVHTNNTDPCSDGNACTTGDTCGGGTCNGGPAPNCDDNTPCTDDSCDATSGCVHTDNTQPCDDGSACTTDDTCGGGTCHGGAAPNCNDVNPCTDDTCDPASGCVHTDNTIACDDANACTQGDLCEGGSCRSGAAVDCNDHNGCTTDSCDTATGCVHVDNTNACNDGNACTTNDTCGGGTCNGGAAPDCDDNNGCTTDSCDPASGCVNANNTNACDDGNACTTNDTCGGGACNGGSAPNCNDSNPCTDDSCDATSGCVHTDNTNACNDGNACTTNDTCGGGTCNGGAAPDCNDNNGCTSDSCDPASGCVNANNTNACDDGNACTTGDTCGGGTCNGGAAPNCNDDNPCTNDSCDGTTGCVHTDNAIACNDGNACTTNDTCGGGTCNGGAAPNCNDNNPCTNDSCDTTTGCVHVNNTNSCNDGNACTTGDTCGGGTCNGGAAPDCNDNNPCTNDSCNAATGCVHVDNTHACNDGNACTTNDTCGGGTCNGGAAPNCNDSNPCTNDSCNAATGCVHANNTNACNDGNACTSGDVCQAGACVGGGATNCNDGNVCTTDSCEPARGCLHADNTLACSDGFICTTNDTCSGGVCVGGPPATPDCKDPKTIGFYKRLCAGPHPEDELTQANVNCVNDWSTFAGATTISNVCTVLNPDPSNDKCLQAESQLMAALLNLCKGRLALGQPIVSTCTDHQTAGQSLTDANTLLANGGRTNRNCVTAQCETEELNSGKAIGATSLRADRIAGGVRVSWTPPPTGFGWAMPTSYSVWRRARGVGSFAIVAVVPGISHDDANVPAGTDYEYGVTVNWP